MGVDHYSSDEEPKNEPVEIVEAYGRHGRCKGRKFETFNLPSKEVVTIMYVSDAVMLLSWYSATSSRWSRDRNKSFYTQVAGKEFRSDDPKLIPPAVRKYLETYKPTEFLDMILVSQSHSYCNKSAEAFGRNFSCVKYGVRGDGTELIRTGDHEQKIDITKHDRLVPYTRERWAKLKSTELLENRLRKMMAAFCQLEVPAMIKHLDTKPVLDSEFGGDTVEVEEDEEEEKPDTRTSKELTDEINNADFVAAVEKMSEKPLADVVIDDLWGDDK